MKFNRHNKILELVAERDIETQEELADLLQASGFKVTQATVSRDIRELKLTKVAGENGKQKYIVLGRGMSETDSQDRYARLLGDTLISMDTARNILVLRTNPGMAPAAGAAVDALGIEALVGSLAGDDTVFCAFKEDEDAIRALEDINSKIQAAKAVIPSKKHKR